MDTIQTIILALLQVLAASAIVDAHTQGLHIYAYTLKNFRMITLESPDPGEPVIAPCLTPADRSEVRHCRLRSMSLTTLQGFQ